MSLLKSHRQVSNSTSHQNLQSGPSTSTSSSSLNKTYKRPHFFRRLFGGGSNNSTPAPITEITDTAVASPAKDPNAKDEGNEDSILAAKRSTSDLTFIVGILGDSFLFFFALSL